MIQAAATWFMTGLIWFVQLVHYPLFNRVGSTEFKGFQSAHVAATTWVVGPPMIVEGLCGFATVLRRPPAVPLWQAWTGLALLIVIWLSTALLQVPQHRRLEDGFDGRAHRKLLATNWIRVAAWSARALLVAVWLA